MSIQGIAIWCFDFEEPVPTSLLEEEFLKACKARGRVGVANDKFIALCGLHNAQDVAGLSISELITNEEASIYVLLKKLWESKCTIARLQSLETDMISNESALYNTTFRGIVSEGSLERVWCSRTRASKEESNYHDPNSDEFKESVNQLNRVTYLLEDALKFINSPNKISPEDLHVIRQVAHHTSPHYNFHDSQASRDLVRAIERIDQLEKEASEIAKVVTKGNGERGLVTRVSIIESQMSSRAERMKFLIPNVIAVLSLLISACVLFF